jgi:hypothetical protein
MKAKQAEFVQSVLAGKAAAELSHVMVPGGRLTIESAVEVYARGYVARLTEALGEIFEGVWWVLGDSDFFTACRAFIAQSPSVSYNLSDFGEGFPTFLKTWRTSEAPYLHDLARYEWLFHEVFHSAPSVEFDHSELNVLQQRSDVALKFQGHLRLFSAPFSVYEMWRQRGEDPETVGLIDWDKPEQLFIFKRDHAIFVDLLDAPSFRLLELLREGLTLDMAVTRTAMLFGSLSEEQVSEFFAELIKAGVISGVACTA